MCFFNFNEIRVIKILININKIKIKLKHLTSNLINKNRLINIQNQLKILFLNREILNREKTGQFEEFKHYLELKILENNKLINSFSTNESAQVILNKKLVISRSAITALNLIKADEEKEYIKKAINDKQSDILRLILLFLNEEFSDIPQAQLPEYFIEKILKKFKVESFSKDLFALIYL